MPNSQNQQQDAESPITKDDFAKLLAKKEVIAWLLNSSERTVLRLCKDQGMPKMGPNSFAIAETVQWYVTHLVTKGHGGENKDIAEERRLLVRAQRQRHELEIQQRRGKLIDAEVIGNLLNEMSTIYSRHLESLSGRLSGRLAGVDSPAEISRILTEESRAIRSATSAAVVDFAATYGGIADTGAATRKKRRAVGRRKKGAPG